MGRGVTIGRLRRTGATFMELVTEMGAQVLCETRRDTKKKIAANTTSFREGRYRGQWLEVTAVCGIILLATGLLVAYLKNEKVNVI